MYTIKKIPFSKVKCQYRDGETRVQQGLAVTPQQALELSQQGVPISTQMANPDMFFDGESNPGEDVPMFRQRGVSRNDMWNEQVRITEKFNKEFTTFRQKRKQERQLEEKGE